MLARYLALVLVPVLLAGCSSVPSTLPDSESPKEAVKKSPAKERMTLAAAPLAFEQAASAWVGVAVSDGLNRRLFTRNDRSSYTSRQVAAAMRQARVTPGDLSEAKAVKELGRHLGARLLVVGRAALDDGRIHGTARVVEVESGKTRVSVKLDAPLSDLAAVEDLIAGRLATVIGGELPGTNQGKASAPVEAVSNTTRVLMLLRRQSLSPRAANPLAAMGVSAEELEEAKKLAKAATGIAPDYCHAWAALGLAEAMGGDTKKALELLDKAIALQPGGTPLTILAHSFALMREGRFDEAEKVLRRAVKEHPGFLHGRGNLAGLLLHFGRLRESRAVFRRYSEVAPNQPWVLAKIAYVNAKLGKGELAVQETKKAVALVPSSVYLLTELASRQIDADDLEGAEQTLLRVLKLAPDHVRANIRLGYVKLLRGDDAGSIASSEKGIELAKGTRHSRDRAYAHLNLARAFGHMGKVELALTNLEKAKSEADVSLDEFELDPALEEVRKNPRYSKILE